MTTAPTTTPVTTDPLLDEGTPRVAHIIGGHGQGSAATAITMALIEGTPVTALCGTVFVPSRDPKKLPACDRCKGIRDQLRAGPGNN